MTIGDMRRLMLKKVVPESVVPQNIVDFLIDENAQLPEPDAFTFLTRLRGLGIGSADFLYLLEGCGAPSAAVEKIKANPAMNLQGLILTLEGSGMTSKDYTRILYTARQIWERTLTLRLETSERISAEEDGENGGTNEVSDNTNTLPDVKSGPAADAKTSDNTAEKQTATYADNTERETLPHGKPPVAYPDATEELMSVDFGSDYEFDDSAADENVNAQNADSGEKDTVQSSFGIGSGGAVDLFGGSGYSGELGYSQSFTESFVNDYMVDFAEDDLADMPEDEDLSDDIGVYYGGFEQFPDEIPEVGNGTRDAAEEQTAAQSASNGIPDAREPFEVHIASYDIPEEPDEFARAREKSAVNAEAASDGAKSGSDEEFEFVEAQELHKKNTAPFEVKIDYGDETQEEAPSNIQQYNGETTMIVPIDRNMIERNISAMAENAPETEQSSVNKTAKTAVQKPAAKTAKQRIKSAVEGISDEDGGETDISRNFGRSDPSGNYYGVDDEDDRRSSGSKKGLVIAAGVGAAVLVGANFAVSHFLGNQDNNKIKYAESADEIFASIYYSYEDKIVGGSTVSEYQTDYSKVFGDLLICGSGLGTFTLENNVYSVSENKIDASVFQNGQLASLGKIEPADGARFVAAFESGSSLIAVYSSTKPSDPNAVYSGECGYLVIKGGETVYTVRQSGRLTALDMKNGEIRLGSVYTPMFYESFDAERTDIYLPKIGRDLKPIDPASVILSRTKGYSYALSAGYSVDSGAVTTVKAALGDPVYASTDGMFFMNGSETKKDNVEEYGLLLSAKDEPVYERCGKISCAASFENGSAVFENGTTVLRDKDLKVCKKLENSARVPTKLRFSGDMLVIADDEGVLVTADCSIMGDEIGLRALRQINGDCRDNSAITLEADTNGIKLTRYVIENGAARAVVSFTRELTDERMKTLVCGSANAMVARSGRCGAAYSYFDGVSVISEYVTLSDATDAATLFDDKTGFEYAFVMNDRIYAVCSKGAVDVAAQVNSGDDPETPPENPPSA